MQDSASKHSDSPDNRELGVFMMSFTMHQKHLPDLRATTSHSISELWI